MILFPFDPIIPIWESRLQTDVDHPVWGMTVDGDGNVYLAGRVNDALPGTTHYGDFDAWLAKYSPTGELLWIEQLGSPADDRAWGIVLDGDYLYITGRTAGDLGGASAGQMDIFLAKYDLNGNLVWVEQYGTPGIDAANAVGVDGAGNVYVTGMSTLSQTGEQHDIHITKFDADGNPLWTTTYGSDQSDYIYRSVVEDDGTLYAVGDSLGDLAAPGSGELDVIITKRDSDGNLLWSDQFGSPDIDRGFRIEVDVAGNVYLSGYTYGALAGDSAGGSDAFLAKYDSEGTLLWIEQLGTPCEDFAYGLAIGENGIYISGHSVFVSNTEDIEFFVSWVASYDESGNLQGQYYYDSDYNDLNRDLAIDGDGTLYLAGYSEGAKGEWVEGDDLNAFTTEGSRDSWIVALDPAKLESAGPGGNAVPAPNPTDTPNYFWHNTATGQVYVWQMEGLTPVGLVDLGTVSPGWCLRGTGDFDGNGSTDLVWRQDDTGDVLLWLMDEVVPVTAISLGSVDLSWELQAVGDFTQDQQPDLVWQNQDTGEVGIWDMDGITPTNYRPVGVVSLDWEAVATADFDGNGDGDLLWRNDTTGETLFWLFDTDAGTIVLEHLLTIAVGWEVTGVADMDQNGSLDLVWNNPSSGETLVWAMDGTAPLLPDYTPAVVTGAWTLVV